MELTHVLKAPVVTEKSTALQAKHKFTFHVHLKATKVDVAHAVTHAYGVKVNKVNFMLVQSKVRMVGRGRAIQKRAAQKKAIVTLDSKQVLDFNKFKV